jgi:hypothetical protein
VERGPRRPVGPGPLLEGGLDPILHPLQAADVQNRSRLAPAGR